MAKRKTPKAEKVIDLTPKPEKITDQELNQLQSTVKTIDARLFLAVGDTIAVTTTADTAVSKDMGIIKSIDSATQITLESAFTTAVVNNDVVHNQAPITFRLHFEY